MTDRPTITSSRGTPQPNPRYFGLKGGTWRELQKLLDENAKLREEAKKAARQFQARGSVLNTVFADRKSPIAYGYDEKLAVYFNQSPLLNVAVDQLVAGDNSSLSIMHDALVYALLKGTVDSAEPWSRAPISRTAGSASISGTW